VFIKEQQGLGGSGLVGICPLSFEIVFTSLFPLLCCCLLGGWEGRSFCAECEARNIFVLCQNKMCVCEDLLCVCAKLVVFYMVLWSSACVHTTGLLYTHASMRLFCVLLFISRLFVCLAQPLLSLLCGRCRRNTLQVCCIREPIL
jgi:hypothetical protein